MNFSKHIPNIYGYIDHTKDNGLMFNLIAKGIEVRLSIPFFSERIIELIRDAHIDTNHYPVNDSLVSAIRGQRTGAIILLPAYDEEFLACMQFRAELNAKYGDGICVMIFHPAAMGTFWRGLEQQPVENLEFTFGAENEYRKCVADAEDDIVEVRGYRLAARLDMPHWLAYIKDVARGAFLRALTPFAKDVSALLMDLWYMPIDLIVVKADGTEREHPFFSEQSTIPCRETISDIAIKPGEKLQLTLSGYVLSEDILAACGISLSDTANVSASLEVGSHNELSLTIDATGFTRTINLDSLVKDYD